MKMYLKLVKYSCGCVGFLPVDNDTKNVIIVDYCGQEREDDDIILCSLDMTDHGGTDLKHYDFLSEDEQKRYYDILGGLIYDGHRLRELKRILEG